MARANVSYANGKLAAVATLHSVKNDRSWGGTVCSTAALGRKLSHSANAFATGNRDLGLSALQNVLNSLIDGVVAVRVSAA